MNFNLEESIEILERTPEVTTALLHGLDEAWTHVNEGKDTWSAFDIIGHLIHGERTDWIPRIKIILGDGEDKTFEPFNRFAQFRNSKGKTLHELLEAFSQLRAQNIAFLTALQLTEKELALKGVHPDFGDVTLQQLIATWVTHDLGHLAQITRVMAKHYTEDVGPWYEYISILKERS